MMYNLNHLARLREIMALQSSHPRATFPVTLQADILKPATVCPKKENCISLSEYGLGFYNKKKLSRFQDIGKYHLNKDDILSFTLHNQSKQDYYCYLINISPDGTIFSIFPDPDERMEYARVNSGEKKELIDNVILDLNNVGEQSLKLIVTTHPIQISLLQKGGYRNKNNLNSLEQLLVSAAHGQRARILRLSNDKWFTKQVTFEVNK